MTKESLHVGHTLEKLVFHRHNSKSILFGKTTQNQYYLENKVKKK